MPRGPAFKRKFRAPKRGKSLFCRVMGLACFGKHCTIGQGWDRIAAPRPVGADVSSRQSGPGLEAMLRPFLDRSVPPRTIIAVDCHWDQLSPATGVSTQADAPTSASRCFSRSPSLTAGALRYRRYTVAASEAPRPAWAAHLTASSGMPASSGMARLAIAVSRKAWNGTTRLG